VEADKLLFQDTDKELVMRAEAHLQESGITSATSKEKDEFYELYVSEEEFDMGKECLIDLLEQEAEELQGHVREIEAKQKLKEFEELEQKSFSKLKTPKQRLEEVSSSAFAFLIVGVIGAIALMLEVLGVFSLGLEGTVKIIFYVTMTVMFTAFIIVGIVNASAMSKWRMKAAEEDIMMNNVREFVKHELKDEYAALTEISTVIKVPDEEESEDAEQAEEEKYFEMEAEIRKRILLEFPELPIYLLEEATEEAIKLL